MTAVAFPVPLTSPVVLAPMSGITDLPFRRVVASFGAGLVVSEMIASGEMVTARPSRRAASRARAEVDADVPTSVQLAGREAGAMAEAARIAEGQGAPIIDINMGCPAKKVVGGAAGSALMREPDLALRLIEAVVGAVSVPVTLKTRLGWDGDCLNAAKIAQQAEGAGVRMITIHGRTRAQFYTGSADWAAIAEVVEAVNVPVLTNGDIDGPEAARQALAQSGGAGVMVGRAAQGRPWLLAQISAALYGTPAPVVPEGAALVDLVAGHYEGMLDFYGRELGVRIARKHLGWYIDAAGGEPAIRARLMRESDAAAVLAALPQALEPWRDAA
ncbi:tRNA dihydrouridine synthase DusB [Pararhodobacter sp.]|uniref:tRNA dihydrouridine synthase DusB n=1 Tax=Pararhodobacter sp. TaxID=2127056 RepID=UPI002AFDF5DF|nr:tRNA dihydrouridine synthase DusB [Pararhodobacter sp.]